MKKVQNFNINILFKINKYYWVLLIELIIVILCINYSYESNDDLAMNLLLSGAYTGEPTEYIIFINYLLAWIVKVLYELPYNVNWYNCILIIYASLVFFFANSIIFIQNRGKYVLYISNGVLFLIFISLLSSMNFSKFAAFGLSISIATLLFIKLTTNQKIIAAIFFIIGSLIRFDLVILTSLYFLPSVIFFYKIILKNKSILLISFLFISSFFLNSIHNSIYYKNSQYADYIKNFNLRSKATTHDNKFFNLSDVKNQFSNIGWSENDFNLISDFMWDLGDPVMNYEKLNMAVSNIERMKLPNLYSLYYQSSNYISFIHEYFIYSGFYLVFILMLLIFYLCRSKQLLFYFIVGVLFVFITLFSFSLFSFFNVYKYRIVFGAIMPFVSSFIFIPFTIKYLNFKSANYLIYIVLLVSFFGFILKFDNSLLYYNQSKLVKLEKNLNSHFEVPYIHWAEIESNSFFYRPQSYTNAIFMGWFSGSPHNLKKIHRLCNCKNVIGIYDIRNIDIKWVFSKNNEYRIEYVKAFYLERFRDVNFKISNIIIDNINYKILNVTVPKIVSLY
jgi:hypothetical protein